MISGFTFIHNALEGGYPIVEAIKAVWPFVGEMVVVDMESTDGTRDVLEEMGVTILDGVWTPGGAGKCLQINHLMHEKCSGDIIWHFEADEIYSYNLACTIQSSILVGYSDMAVYRIQVEQNFQRVRWYPEPVHRIFPKGSVLKDGHTTDVHTDGHIQMTILAPSCGLLWDVTNCFRDNYLGRVKNQAELWGGDARRLMVPIHALSDFVYLTEAEAQLELEDPRWTWLQSPFDLPRELKKLVGMTKYMAVL